MGLINMFLGLEDIEVNGKMHVGTFQKKFKKAFGTESTCQDNTQNNHNQNRQVTRRN